MHPILKHPSIGIKFDALKQRFDSCYWCALHALDDAFTKYDNGPLDLPWIVDDGPHDLPTIMNTGRPW